MNKRKKYIVIRILLLIFIMTGALEGCGLEKTESVLDETASEEVDYRNDGYIVVGIAQIGSESDWRAANTESFRQVFSEQNGYYLMLEDGQQKQENQVKAIRKFILQKVDYIILDPVVETGWDAVLREAKDAGIPVILSDRKISREHEDLYTCWVGSDFEKEGRRAGEWLERYLEQSEKAGEAVNIVTLQGTLDSTAQIGRSKGFEEVLNRHDDWTMLEEMGGEFTHAKGREVMEYFLQKYKDIDVVISQNDNMTFGAIEAIEYYGKKIGKDEDIILLSFDGIKDALEEIQAGNIIAEFECNPLIAPFVEKVIEKLEKGESVEKNQYIEETYFDYEMDIETIKKDRVY